MHKVPNFMLFAQSVQFTFFLHGAITLQNVFGKTAFSKLLEKLEIQSNLDIMPPIGTEVKWHSSKSGIVTRVCYSIDETINATNKTINDYSVCKVHVRYSPSYLTQAKTLKNRQLSHVLSANLVYFIF